MKKLSGDLRKFLTRDHRKITWTFDDFLKALRRELQKMEVDKTIDVNSMTKLHPHLTAAFHIDQTQNSKEQNRIGCGIKNYIKTKDTSRLERSSHRASDCLKYTIVNDRLEVAKRKKLIFHFSEKTTKMDRFLQLNAKENPAESMAESTTQHFTRNATEKRKMKKQQRPQKYNQTSPTPIRARSKKNVATVVNGIKTVKGTFLLDDGSPATFCTLMLAQTFQLASTSPQRVSISPFGSEEKRTDVTT